ncbi:MAG TPA: hypothetical protein VHN77_04570 [Phycisphaerales bacterium]|nr:hypothetical protein [Phycisphaerales bacterium]
MNRSFQTAALKDRLGAIHACEVGREVITTAAEVDLRMRTLHEWFAGSTDPHGRDWSACLLPLLDVVMRGFASGRISHLVWIGRRVFPYPLALTRQDGLLCASVFVDPPNAAARLWAIDLALRTTTPTAVIADGQGFTLANTRRLQLAASAGRGICLLARPSTESQILSAATTRWRTETRPTSNTRVGWMLTLLRNKDLPTLTDDVRAWAVEWNDGLVAVPTLVAGRAGDPQAWLASA